MSCIGRDLATNSLKSFRMLPRSVRRTGQWPGLDERIHHIAQELRYVVLESVDGQGTPECDGPGCKHLTIVRCLEVHHVSPQNVVVSPAEALMRVGPLLVVGDVVVGVTT